jgi:hypothetical protein
MPRCDEPWYEFKFENPKEGTAQVSSGGVCKMKQSGFRNHRLHSCPFGCACRMLLHAFIIHVCLFSQSLACAANRD